MTNRIQAWQCTGCGKLDAPQPCIGICQDQKVELVGAEDYDSALARISELETVLRILAQATPRDGEWERSYRQLQERSRQLIWR